ncbi:MAG: zinc-binding dehydrogenase [Chlorobi bacterium]|nr:zinc-binding dehydrogenase [Chlorobiota bacterium]
MKAIFLVKYGNARQAFEIRDIEIPAPGKGQLLLKVETFGLNFADVMARKGLYREAPPLPAVLGYEVVGTVEKTGTGADAGFTGKKVVAFTRFGGYAQYVIADARAVAELPSGYNNGQAAALSTQYCTAYFAAYDMANLRKGETVLIHAAAGGVGIALTQLAKLRQCIVIGTAGSDEKLEFIQKQGVDYPVNYRTHDFAEAISGMQNMEGVDVIFDPVGGKSVKKGKALLQPGGRLITFGASDQLNRRKGMLSGLKLMLDFGFIHPVGLLMKSNGIIGVNMLRIAEHKPMILKETLESVVKLAEEKIIQPVVGKEYPANDIAEAHDFFESRKSMGKIVLHW